MVVSTQNVTTFCDYPTDYPTDYPVVCGRYIRLQSDTYVRYEGFGYFAFTSARFASTADLSSVS